MSPCHVLIVVPIFRELPIPPCRATFLPRPQKSLLGWTKLFKLMKLLCWERSKGDEGRENKIDDFSISFSAFFLPLAHKHYLDEMLLHEWYLMMMIEYLKVSVRAGARVESVNSLAHNSTSFISRVKSGVEPASGEIQAKMDPRAFFMIINCLSTHPNQPVPSWSDSDPSAVIAEEFGVLLILVNAADRRQCQLGSLHLLCTNIFPTAREKRDYN